MPREKKTTTYEEDGERKEKEFEGEEAKTEEELKEELPTGKEQPFEDSKEVQSEVSLQRQYIPEDANRFIDMISGEIERVSQE